MPKLVWRVKVITELEPGVATEAEVARIERGEEAGLAELGLRLEEAKRLTAALQAEIVTTQVATAGERPRPCAACGQMLVSKGHYRATFRSLFGDVPVRVRRLLACPCQGPSEPRSFAAVDLGGGGVAPELAYVTARYAALAPFGKVAAPPCCMGRRCGRTEPGPCSGSCDADVLRASEVEHSVQHLGRDRHLGRLAPIRLEA